METGRNRQPELTTLLETIKAFKGFTRKTALAELIQIIGEESLDDAGALRLGGKYVVVSTDGIVENLVRADPWLAGFYSVVVNVNDVAAKGATPSGYTCVVSSSSAETRRRIVQGIKHGLDKYALKFLKGHTHADTSFNAIDAAAVGFAEKILPSTCAKPRDSLVMAVDLEGKQGGKGWLRTFDSVKDKNGSEVRKRLRGVVEIANEGLANACRDVSGPGLVGTVAMLCESSRVGAEIQLEAVPKPSTVSLDDWLITYPSMGFVFATSQPAKCVHVLENHGFAAHAIGSFLNTPVIELLYGAKREVFMDLRRESVFGFKKLEK